jgi:ABC-type dipeptide/oligopeptide/nickel transport system permease subunit
MSESVVAAPLPAPRPASRMAVALHFAWQNKGVVVAGATLCVILVAAVATPLIAPHDPTRSVPRERLAPPFWLDGGTTNHLLGTDGIGRDVLSRLLYGLRISLVLSVSAVALALALGMAVGLTAGYVGGIVDTVLMRIVDTQLAFPYIVLAVAVLSIAPRTLPILIVVLSLAAWPFYARVIRASALTQRNADFVVAARALGASTPHVIWSIFRNIMPPLVVVVTLDIATMIIWEALLGFVGIGVQPPTPSWGTIMADGKTYIVNAWWLVTLPGAAIFITLMAINLFGDSLQRYIDPRLR